jgi:phage tail-like protein
MADDAKQAYGNYHFVLEIPDVDQALLFFQVTPPSVSVDVKEFVSWDAKGNPVKTVGSGRQITYGDLQLSRGIDKDLSLWKWLDDIRQKGVGPDTKKDLKLTALDAEGNPLYIWNIKGAGVHTYSHSGANAQTNEVLVENVSIKFEDLTLEAA